jgi:hypothetical protein
LTGITIAQISEFSLIFAMLGLSLGHISNEIFSIIVAVGIISIILSTYFILYAENIFLYISSALFIFERENLREEGSDYNISRPIILIGANRIGKGIMSYIKKEDLLVIDYDPIVSDYLKKNNIERIFSDLKDPHLFEEINLTETKLIISTSPFSSDNMSLIERIKKIDKKIKIIVRAEEDREAVNLYKQGADYVLLPHLLSGKYLGELIKENSSLDNLKTLREKDLEFLSRI